VTALVPVFVTVTVLAALAVPVNWFPKFRLAGANVSDAAAAPVPVPERETT